MIAHLQLYIGPWLMDDKTIALPSKEKSFEQRVARREARVTEECIDLFTRYAKAATMHRMRIEVTFASSMRSNTLTPRAYQKSKEMI